PVDGRLADREALGGDAVVLHEGALQARGAGGGERAQVAVGDLSLGGPRIQRLLQLGRERGALPARAGGERVADGAARTAAREVAERPERPLVGGEIGEDRRLLEGPHVGAARAAAQLEAERGGTAEHGPEP